MELPDDQIIWMSKEIIELMDRCRKRRIHPAVFLFGLHAAAENAYMDKLPTVSQEEWDGIVQRARDEMQVAKRVSDKEISVMEGAREVQRIRSR